MKKITIDTQTRTEFVDITEKVQRQVSETRIDEGIAVVYCPHTTAGIIINEHADPAVMTDVGKKTSELIPRDPNFTHTEGNSDAHIKALLVGSSQTIFVKKGRLVLGTWQGIFFCEFDGPRSRKAYVKVIKD